MAASRRVVAAFDKFRGSATARALGEAVGDAAWDAGWDCTNIPLADGGEGTLDALATLGGSLRTETVTGPLGAPLQAHWLERGQTAFVEMAQASGLSLAGGPTKNDPLEATTRGTGELIMAAARSGAKRIVVLLGGSATTDGGLGAIDACRPLPRLKGIELVVACDVETTFVDAAEVFGPQKGATSAQVKLLTRRLERLADVYEREFGVDVRTVSGSGAAGGLAGALVAMGARLESGFSLIAEEVGLADAIATAEFVITGEGFFDAVSFQGKVVGGVIAHAASAGTSAMVVCGGREEELNIPQPYEAFVDEVVSLSERYGSERSWNETIALVREVALDALRTRT